MYNDQRWEFFMDKLERITTEIAKNEKSLTENFLVQKLLANQAWPWINLD